MKLILAISILALTSCDQLRTFVNNNEPLIEEGAVTLFRSGFKAGASKLRKTAAKNPVQVFRSTDN